MYPAPPASGAPSGQAPAASGPGQAPATAPYGTAPYGPQPGPTQYGPQYGPTQYGPQYGPQYGQTPYGHTRPMAPPPVRPQAVPRTALPPRPRATGPGSRAVGVVLALGLMVLAGLQYADRVDAFDGPVVLTAAAVLVVLCGLGIAAAGALGRRSGGLGAIALVTILVVAPMAAATNISWNTSVGDRTFVPQDVATAELGYDHGVGNITVDLTEVPTFGSPVAVPVHLGAGDMRVILPQDGAYTARVRVSAGQLIWLDDTVTDGVSSVWRTIESPAVQDGAEPDFELEITVGAGSLRVIEESR